MTSEMLQMKIQKKLGEAILNVAVTSHFMVHWSQNIFLKRKEFTQRSTEAYESGAYSIRLLRSGALTSYEWKDKK